MDLGSRPRVLGLHGPVPGSRGVLLRLRPPFPVHFPRGETHWEAGESRFPRVPSVPARGAHPPPRGESRPAQGEAHGDPGEAARPRGPTDREPGAERPAQGERSPALREQPLPLVLDRRDLGAGCWDRGEWRRGRGENGRGLVLGEWGSGAGGEGGMRAAVGLLIRFPPQASISGQKASISMSRSRRANLRSMVITGAPVRRARTAYIMS